MISKYNFNLDTGSPISLIPLRIYNSFLSNYNFQPTQEKVQGISGHEVKVEGKIDTTITVDNRTATTSLLFLGRPAPRSGIGGSAETVPSPKTFAPP